MEGDASTVTLKRQWFGHGMIGDGVVPLWD